MNAEQFKRTNNSFFFITIAAIICGLLISSVNILFEMPLLHKAVSVIASIICIGISGIGNFKFSTEIKGAHRISIGGLLFFALMMILTDNPIFLSFSLPIVIFSIMYAEIKLCIIEVTILSAGFILSAVKAVVLYSVIEQSVIPTFLLLLLSSLACFLATSLLSAINSGNTFVKEPAAEEPQKNDEMLDLDLWLDDEEDEKENDYLDDDYEIDNEEDDPDDDSDEMPNSIYIPQSASESESDDLLQSDKESSENETFSESEKIQESVELPLVEESMSQQHISFNEIELTNEIDELNKEKEALAALNSRLITASDDLISLVEKSDVQFASLKDLYVSFNNNIQMFTKKENGSSESLDAGNKLLKEIDENATYAVKLSSSVLEASENARQKLSLSSDSLNELKEISNSYENSTSSCMETTDELFEKLRKIQEYVDTLTSIAKQAELLSLNASIESARAGEAGKGFAQVASDVREFGNEASRVSGEVMTGINSLSEDLEKIKAEINSASEIITGQNSKIDTTEGNLYELGTSLSDYSSVCDEITQKMDSIRVSSAAVSGDLQALDEDNASVYTKANDLARTSNSISTGLEMYRLLLSEILELAKRLKEISISSH